MALPRLRYAHEQLNHGRDAVAKLLRRQGLQSALNALTEPLNRSSSWRDQRSTYLRVLDGFPGASLFEVKAEALAYERAEALAAHRPVADPF